MAASALSGLLEARGLETEARDLLASRTPTTKKRGAFRGEHAAACRGVGFVQPTRDVGRFVQPPAQFLRRLKMGRLFCAPGAREEIRIDAAPDSVFYLVLHYSMLVAVRRYSS